MEHRITQDHLMLLKFRDLRECNIVGNRMTLSRWIAAGEFPAPIRIGRNSVAWSYQAGGIMNVLLDPKIESATRLLQIQDYFRTWGPAAPGAYLLVVIVEVIVAPIPGALLYLPGGLIFGWLIGGTVSLAGNVLGAGIACQITRTIGKQRIEQYLERPTLQKYLT